MATFNNPLYDSIMGTTSLNYNKILKSTNSFDLFKKEYMNSFTSGTSTCTKSLDSEELRSELPKEHLKSVMFNCENLWEEKNA